MPKPLRAVRTIPHRPATPTRRLWWATLGLLLSIAVGLLIALGTLAFGDSLPTTLAAYGLGPSNLTMANPPLDDPSGRQDDRPASLVTPAPTRTTAPASSHQPAPGKKTAQVPVYSSFDFLRDYLTNITYPILFDGQPWDNGSTNYTEYQHPGGGTSYWDYWPATEPWDSPNHRWRDDQGNWHPYQKEIVRDSTGRDVTFYVLVDRPGPGVMDKLWFTHDAVNALMGIRLPDPPELREWGNLAKLGNLRIQVDDRSVFDGPIQTWMSGDAQQMTPALKQILVWRFGQLGSNGNILPIPYQRRLKVSVYGGSAKPKWFMVTGLSLPGDSRVESYTPNAADLPLQEMDQLAENVLHPENYLLNRVTQNYALTIQPGGPAQLAFPGSGTVAAMQFQIPKVFDPKRLSLRVRYDQELAIDLPLIAFFGEPDRISLHRSTPIGIIDLGNAYLFYCNWPMPFQNGIVFELASDSPDPIQITARIALLPDQHNTQLRVLYKPGEQLEAFGPDYRADLQGDGKLVGLVLVTTDSHLTQVPRSLNPSTGQEDGAKRVWGMGYLEGNLTLMDGAGNSRYYSGQEDWAEGGYYFNSGFTLPSGGGNRPFAGVLRYQPGNDGYATLFRYFNDLAAFPFQNGLHLLFGHGTWNNNFPVRYGTTLYYYRKVAGIASTRPASDFAPVAGPAPGR